MSEADVRSSAPSRGRSTTSRGRAGFGRGVHRGSRKVNGTSVDAARTEESLEDQGELGEMKKKYFSEVSMLKDMFPDWTDTDLVFALQETDGDITATVDKITQGSVSQFAEVKKSKDRARSKAKEEPAIASATEKAAFASRGRGRGGLDSTRGGRGRVSDRGRGGHRSGRGGHATANGNTKEGFAESVPTTESTAWNASADTATLDAGWASAAAAPVGEAGSEALATDSSKFGAADGGQSAWGNVVASEITPAAASEGAKSSLIPEGGPKKSWASMFAKPKSAQISVPQKQILIKQQPPPAELVASGHLLMTAVTDDHPTDVSSELEPAPVSLAQEPAAALEPVEVLEERPITADGDELTLTPSKDPLTEENVEHLPDESHPPATQTVASTTGSIDPRNLTPLPAHHVPIARPPMGGFATSANRLAGTSVRSASFQRRVQEQQEAVVMPGHNAMDRTAVQFGSMGLNGEQGLDVDEEREEPETRLPPQHSPPSQPRTSLPPVPRAAVGTQELSGEALTTPKQAPGLPPASAHNQQQILQDAAMGPNLPQEQQQNHAYNQYGRFGQQEPNAAQKPYDPFAQPAQQSQFEQYSAHGQQPQQQQPQQAPGGFGGLSSAPNDYSSYYSNDQTRNAYNQYYGNSFGLHDTRGQAGQSQGQHDVGGGPQRTTSGFGATPHDSSSAFASQGNQHPQSRFGEAPGSGNNTPHPSIGGQQQSTHQLHAQQSQHSMHHQPQGLQQGGYGGNGAAAGFPYGHPYYNSPYQQAYQNQFGYSPQAGGYGGYPAKQGGMYGGGPHGYGMGSQSSYEQHSSSPANATAFSQSQQSSMRSNSGMGSGLGGLEDYGRGSQSGSHQQGASFSGVNDPFARSASGFGAQGYGQQHMSSSTEDGLKPFNDSKGGPSPALSQPGRPGSAANSAAGTTQGGLPPPQTQNSGFGGYGGFLGQGSQYGGGLGGLGSHQQGHSGMSGQSAYGNYGAFSQTYGAYGASRGGWGANYSGH